MNLYLFTNSFPYLPGEEFLETEIWHLANQFKTIIVVPKQKLGVARDLPLNVSVDDSLAEQKTRLGNYTRLLLSSISSLKYTAIHRTSDLFDVTAVKRITGHIHTAKRVYRWLEANVDKDSLDKSLFYSYWFNGVPTALAKFSEVHHLLFITRAHRVDLYFDAAYKGIFPYRRYVLDRIHSVHPCSEHGREHLAEHFPLFVSKFHTSRLGVNYVGTNPPNNDSNLVHVVSCAYVTEVKQLHLLAKAVEILAVEHPAKTVRWTHFGDGPLLNDLRDRIKDAPSNLFVNFKGASKNKDILHEYSKIPFDVFVNCSSSEGLPVSIMEAMSFEIPVVAPDVGGISELVNDENGKLLSSCCDSHEIATAILSTKLAGATKRESTQKAFQKIVCAKTNYSGFCVFLKQVLSASRDFT